MKWSLRVLGAISFILLVLCYLETRGVTTYTIKSSVWVRQLVDVGQFEAREDPEIPESVYETLNKSQADIEVDGHKIVIKTPPAPPLERPFTVHLILHSHVDPGWLLTIEEYYQKQVKTILDGAVRGLAKYSHLKFIWSEMSFLERWWRDATEQQKNIFHEMLANGRIELCGGGWVMTDEATPHFSATIDNMVEGQQFMLKTFNRTAETSWSVDPFGHGLMMPMLLPLSGIKNMVVGRLNDILKEQLRITHNMRWRWKQSYDMGRFSDPPYVLTLPYLYYTTVDACGPRKEICCASHVGAHQTYYQCSEGMDSMLRRDRTKFKNYIGELVDQWKHLQRIYNTDQILVPIGNDFYLDNMDDWDVIANTWAELFKVVEENKTMGVKVKFSTVREYFNSLDTDKFDTDKFPTLKGDFFPYIGSESDTHKYWTGYFTHRPHHKRVERTLMNQLRAFDFLSVLWKSTEYNQNAVIARRNLALFQHHDGITGTSKPHVMTDYLLRMQNSSVSLLGMQRELVGKELHTNTSNIKTSERAANDQERDQPPHNVFQVSIYKRMSISVFNQLPSIPEQRIFILVDTPKVGVQDASGTYIQAQISPYVNGVGAMNATVFELSFYATLTPLSLNIFKLIEGETENTAIASVSAAEGITVPTVFMKKNLNQTAPLLNTGKFILQQNGKDLNLSQKDGNSSTSFAISYETFDDVSGAYVFQSRGIRKALSNVRPMFTFEGPLESVFVFEASDKTKILQIVRIFNKSPDYLSDVVQLESFPKVSDNEDLFLRFNTNIHNQMNFSTDINAMYNVQRSYDGGKPFEANVFAAPTASFIQDDQARLTVFSGQTSGATSEADRNLMVHLDRILTTDDGKGLSYGDAKELRLANLRHRVLVEARVSGSSSGCCHSIIGQKVLDTLLFPPVVFLVRESDLNYGKESLLSGTWPCTIQLISLRYLDDKQILVVLRRIAFDQTVGKKSECQDNLEPVWEFLNQLSANIFHTTLTGTIDGKEATVDSLEDELEQTFHIVSLKLKV